MIPAQASLEAKQIADYARKWPQDIDEVLKMIQAHDLKVAAEAILLLAEVRPLSGNVPHFPNAK